jgi:hypothetical protein
VALCRELENFSPKGTILTTLLTSVLATSSRWLARILYTLPPDISEQTFNLTREDLSPIRSLFASGFQPNYPFPSRAMSMPHDDSTISSGSTSTSTSNRDYIATSRRDFIPGFPIESSIQPENSVKHTMGSRGQPTILIEPPFLDPVSETATTIPLPTHSISSDQPHTAPVFDPLRLYLL